MKASSSVAAALLLASTLAGCSGDDSDNDADRSRESPQRTLTYESQLTTSSTAPDRGSTGQQLVMRAMLYTPGARAATARSQATCTRTQPGAGEVYNCQLVYLFPTGKLYALAASSRQGPATGIIAGGTGSYANARGSFRYDRTQGSRSKLTVMLF